MQQQKPKYRIREHGTSNYVRSWYTAASRVMGSIEDAEVFASYADAWAFLEQFWYGPHRNYLLYPELVDGTGQ